MVISNFDEAQALVSECLFKIDPKVLDKSVGLYADCLAKMLKKKVGIEPICTPESRVSDVACSLLDV